MKHQLPKKLPDETFTPTDAGVVTRPIGAPQVAETVNALIDYLAEREGGGSVEPITQTN